MGLRSWFRGKLAAEEGASSEVLRLVDRVASAQGGELEVSSATGRPTAQELHAWAAASNVVLPEEFVTFTVHHFNALRLEASPSFWPKVRPGAPAPYWKMLRGVTLYGFGPSVEVTRRLEVQAHLGRAPGGPLPLLKRIGDKELLGVTPNREWVHWTLDAPNVLHRCAQQSFVQLLRGELDALLDRVQRIRDAA